MKGAAWSIREIDISEFRDITLQDFTRLFRSSSPALIIYRLKHLPWAGVVRTAPINQAMCALSDDTPVVHESTTEWAREQVSDRTVYKAFCRDLKEASLSRESMPTDLFGAYVQFGGYGGSKSRLGGFGRWQPYMGRHRVRSHLIPSKAVQSFVHYHECQLAQFGEYAMIDALEGADFSEGSEYRQTRAVWTPELTVFQGVRRENYSDDLSYGNALCEVLDLLNKAILDNRSRERAYWDIHYEKFVRPPVFFGADLIKWGSGYDKLEEDVLLLRAKFVRHLGWPQLYGIICGQVDMLNEAISGEFGLISEPDRTEFYKRLCDELQLYMREMESLYPILLEDPLKETEEK